MTGRARKAERAKHRDAAKYAQRELEALALKARQHLHPFHWWLEFPEVFFDERPDPLQGGVINGVALMDGVVGNPPFIGGRTISTNLGDGYRDWLKIISPGANSNSDISAHFFRRAATLIGEHGTFGLIATNTISQGDTRATGLAALIGDKWKLYRANDSKPWPGGAAVTVSIVNAAHGCARDHIQCKFDDGQTEGQLDCNGSERWPSGFPVAEINSRLLPKPERSEALPLVANESCSFQGSIVLGMGFTLTPTERDALIAREPKNAERIFPYLGGEEVNTSPTQVFDRYVISFGQMPLEEAERWPDLLRIVREKVKPERDRVNRDAHRKFWWHYADKQPALYAAIAPLERCLVTGIVSKNLMFSFQPTNRIFSNKLVVFPLDRFAAFAVLQSRVHEPWTWLLSSTMKLDLNYSPSDCFETFPFPKPDPRSAIPALESAGQALYGARAKYMLDTEQGLTKTYNALKDETCTDPRIVDLRCLHEAMDRAVLDAYGWNDLDVPPYCPQSDTEKQALRTFEDEVIDRLYALNAERARDEERLGLGRKKGKRVAKTDDAGDVADEAPARSATKIKAARGKAVAVGQRRLVGG